MTAALPAGVVTPLVTFVDDHGEPDPSAIGTLVDHQLAHGVAGLLAVGSTGELGNLTGVQRARTIEIVATASAGRAPVWGGVAGLGTAETVVAAREAEAAGADAVLVLPPLFFDSSDTELQRHFTLVADAVDVPVIAYDVPPRTPRKLPTNLIAALAHDGVLRAVKDSSSDFTTGRLTIEATSGVEGFRNYAGAEITLEATFALGFDGVVPGLANVVPQAAVQIFDAWRAGDLRQGLRGQRQCLRLFDILRVALPYAGGPAAAVAAIKCGTAHVLGLPVPATAEPMTPATDEFARAVAQIVDEIRAADDAAA